MRSPESTLDPSREVRAEAAAALAAAATSVEGRHALRRCGALRPLVVLLSAECDGGRPTAAAETAALAIMNTAVCAICKPALYESGVVQPLLAAVRSVLPPADGDNDPADDASDCNDAQHAGGGIGSRDQQPEAARAKKAAAAAAAAGGAQDADAAGSKAAGYAAGALMNLMQLEQARDEMLRCGADAVLSAVLRQQVPANASQVLTTRCNFMAEWLNVAKQQAAQAAAARQHQLLQPAVVAPYNDSGAESTAVPLRQGFACGSGSSSSGLKGAATLVYGLLASPAKTLRQALSPQRSLVRHYTADQAAAAAARGAAVRSSPLAVRS